MLARPKRAVSESSVKIGYACVFKEEQNSGQQLETLERTGVAWMFEGYVGGACKYALACIMSSRRSMSVLP
jgi:hypothetical protein